ncbi:hypothetical protein HUZ94_07035 [Cronobacter sakazakii]|uniref:hypothetical protein n=1 Tax=Cronobacter sakazakii TaxID=28141 RepID=UPI001588136A|nr:hypothetical protein [Cronobacter sakazakii]NUW63336.1 hypothetical protein [Cronobacter sakazakii]
MSTEQKGICINDSEWGCRHTEYHYQDNEPTIIACIVNVDKIDFIAAELVKSVLDTSWISSLDSGTQLSYSFTAKETAEALVKVFNKVIENKSLEDEFGELMVSIGSSRALSQILKHVSLPIAELWKPQVKQNEGFDFHTTCPSQFINFGEAKFSSCSNPHGNAINQAVEFIRQEKHFRDRVHLINLCSPDSVANLDKKEFGLIAAFSINSENCERIMDNAIKTVKGLELSKIVKFIYLVGVKC